MIAHNSSARSSLRKLTPRTKLPASNVLRTLKTSDMAVLEQTLSETLECVVDPLFRLRSTQRSVLGPAPDAEALRKPRPVVSNDDSGLDLLAAASTNQLTAEQERHLFLRMNFCKYQAMRILAKFKDQKLTAEAARALICWMKEALDTRGQIVRANIPLVLAMAKRARIHNVEFTELISEGNFALLRSVDKFDVSRGFKFSTYACRAILKSFSRIAARTARYRGAFPAEFDPSLEKSDELERQRVDEESHYLGHLKSILGHNTAQLSDVEERIIRARFGLDDIVPENEAPRLRTLEQVGDMFHVTKERVRQIQNRALLKLRDALHERMQNQ